MNYCTSNKNIFTQSCLAGVRPTGAGATSSRGEEVPLGALIADRHRPRRLHRRAAPATGERSDPAFGMSKRKTSNCPSYSP